MLSPQDLPPDSTLKEAAYRTSQRLPQSVRSEAFTGGLDLIAVIIKIALEVFQDCQGQGQGVPDHLYRLARAGHGRRQVEDATWQVLKDRYYFARWRPWIRRLHGELVKASMDSVGDMPEPMFVAMVREAMTFKAS